MATPKSLKLEFSKAADFERVSHLFEPEVKDTFDPEHCIVKRLSSVFKKSVDSGCAAFLSDENGDLRTMTIAYHLYIDKNSAPEAPHDHTEFGSSLSLIPGYKSSVPVIAALALREWFNHPPVKTIAAEIKQDNTASVKTYNEALGWNPLHDTDQCASLDVSGWRTVPDESDPTGQTGLEKVPDGLGSMDWFQCDDDALVKQARIVLDFMKSGGLVNKTGHFIPVDFSALETEGLTRPRLEAIAGGTTDRSKLAKITP